MPTERITAPSGPASDPADPYEAYRAPHERSTGEAHEEQPTVDLAEGRNAAKADGRSPGRTKVGRTAAFVVGKARRASHAEGAGESGLSRLIELHAFHAAGDAAVAVALAGTIFFANPGEARGNVALFLGLTMLPFAIVAPLVGPFLDRFSHGRRWAIGATMALRAFLCWVMADAISAGSVWMYPCALGVLVSSKAYGVARAAAVPRLLPQGLTLVKANSRISLAGIIGASVSGPVAALVAQIGAEWCLRYAFVVFVVATVLAILLPAQADNSQGSQTSGGKQHLRLPVNVVYALRSNVGLRILSGFLTMYMAFLLRQHPLPGWENRATLLLGLVIGSAGLGNLIGIGLGTRVRQVQPSRVLLAALLADAVAAVLAAVFYGLFFAVLLGLTAGLCQAIGKLALDATIQAEIGEQTRTAAFARSETLLQLSWVVGGFIGIALPLVPWIGLGTLALILVAWSVFVWTHRPADPTDPAKPTQPVSS